MAHQAVRSALYQLMAVFDSDGAAPIAANPHACPDSECYSYCSERCSSPEQGQVKFRKDSEVQPVRPDSVGKKQPERKDHRKTLRQSRGIRLPLDALFGGEGAYKPEDPERAPEIGDSRMEMVCHIQEVRRWESNSTMGGLLRGQCTVQNSLGKADVLLNQ